VLGGKRVNLLKRWAGLMIPVIIVALNTMLAFAAPGDIADDSQNADGLQGSDSARGDESFKNFPSFIEGNRFLKDNFRVMATDGEYIWAVGDPDRRGLYKSDDYGDTWQEVYVFDKEIQGMHFTKKGSMLVSVSTDRWAYKGDGQLFRSQDGGKSFEHVLDFESGVATSWNMASDDEGYVYASEYGYKRLPDNSRRIYRSKDDGWSWEIIYSPEEQDQYHNHIIIIDNKNPNIIYQSVGDFHNASIIKSTDRGKTWKTIAKGYHPTSAVQFDDYIVLGLDSSPYCGIAILNKQNDTIENTFILPEGYGGSVYDMLYVNDVIYAGFLSYAGYEWDGTIFISKDKGRTWEKLANWPKFPEQAVGFLKFTALGDYGFIAVTMPVMGYGNDGYYRGTVRFPLIQAPQQIEAENWR